MPAVETKCLWCGTFCHGKCRDLAYAFNWRADSEVDALLNDTPEDEDARREALRAHAEYPGDR